MASLFDSVSTFLNDNRDLAVPIVRGLVYGRDGASAAEMESNRAYYNRINGSGAPDSDGAIRDAMRRDNTPGLSFSGGAGGINPLWVGVALVGAILLALIFRRR